MFQSGESEDDMQKSKKGTLNLRDLLRGALFGSSGPLLTLLGIMASGHPPTKEQLAFALWSFAGSFGAYLIKHIPEGDK